MKHVAIQKDLTPIKSYLEQKGYNVCEFEGSPENAAKDADAIVVTGLDNNVMGIETSCCKASIINADGKEPSEVEKEICNCENCDCK